MFQMSDAFISDTNVKLQIVAFYGQNDKTLSEEFPNLLPLQTKSIINCADRLVKWLRDADVAHGKRVDIRLLRAISEQLRSWQSTRPIINHT